MELTIVNIMIATLCILVLVARKFGDAKWINKAVTVLAIGILFGVFARLIVNKINGDVTVETLKMGSIIELSDTRSTISPFVVEQYCKLEAIVGYHKDCDNLEPFTEKLQSTYHSVDEVDDS